MGWPPTYRDPRASAQARSAALVLATSVMTASGARDPDHGPAKPSSSSRHAVAGPPRTTRSASSMAAGTSGAARSITPSVTAEAGPAPDGLQLASGHEAVSDDARRARATDPEIR